MKKIFGEINLTWKKLIIFAILAGIYTAIMSILSITKNTSFADITINFEVWILFGIMIIMNSKSAKDSALKCFVFFLISQPLVYLIQVPFNNMGWGIFTYYKYWFIWTLFTIPMGFIGYYLKKDKWWGVIILIPILLLLGGNYYSYLRETIYHFPYHLLSAMFCCITLILYTIGIFNNKKVRLSAFIIGIIIILIATIMAFANKKIYSTTILVNSNVDDIDFNEKYNIYLEKNLGKVYIEYDKSIENYMIKAEFIKAGKTKLILEDENKNKTVFEITVGNDTFDLSKK